MISILNMRDCKPGRHPYDVVVDRSSDFGNPFPLCGEETRDRVCDDYAEYFDTCMSDATLDLNYAAKELVELYEKRGRLNLYCWCAPKRCHAEIIKDYILQQSKGEVH